MPNLKTLCGFLGFIAMTSMASALLCPAVASAAAIRDVSVEELVQGSDAVVRGTVRTIESRLVDDGRRIVTLVDVTVLEDYAGGDEQVVQVLLPGGEHGDLIQTVSATPSFSVGEEVVLFLERHPSTIRALPRRFTLRAMAVGAFFIEGDRALRRICGLRLLVDEVDEVDRQSAVHAKDKGISMDQLEDRIRKAFQRVD